MIKIKLKKDGNNFKQITIKGHALFDDFGKDIVCAAVSSCIITSINASLLINKDSLSYNNNKGLDISILSNDNITNILMGNMINNLKELEKAYPQNIQIEEENNE